MSIEQPVVGIDLGTSNICISIEKKVSGRSTYAVLENNQGFNTTPSYIGFGEVILIGQPAKEQKERDHENTVYGLKRLIGHKLKDPIIQKYIQYLPYKLTEDKNGEILVNVLLQGERKQYYPEQIIAQLLDEVAKIVKNKTGYPPGPCVITVPAYFSNPQREATKRAGEISGLNIIHILNEPTAAAIAFQNATKLEKGTVLVFDFGGGTLDVSILEVNKNNFRVLSVAGNSALGGEDIDNLIIEDMITRFIKKNPGSDPRKNPRSLAVLKMKAEEAKISLSSAEDVSIVVPSFCDGANLNEKFSRPELVYIMDQMLEELIKPVEKAIADADLTEDDISHVIMVGGSSKIPAVRDKIEEFFPEQPVILDKVSPDEAIAIGASIVADKMSKGLAINDATENIPAPHDSIEEDSDGGNDEPDDNNSIVFVDVQPMSIGIKSGNDNFVPFIFCNKPLPQRNSFLFKTTKDNKTSVMVEIFQGESKKVTENIFLGKFTLRGIPKRPKGKIMIEVQMSVDVTGILDVKANYHEGGICKAGTIEAKTRFDGESGEIIRTNHQILSKLH